MNDDEKLNGFLDGELAPVDHAAMEARIAADHAEMVKLDAMQTTDDLVRAAYSDPMSERVPDRFMAVLAGGIAEPANNIPRDPQVPHSSNDNARGRWRMGGAIAASLTVGLLLGTQVISRGHGDDSITSIALRDVLNATPSAQSVALASGERITPQLSFPKVGGGYCRQFSLVSADRSRMGIACTSHGSWTIEALLPATAKATANDGFAVAEGPVDPGLAAVIETLRGGDPLDNAGESELIERHWK